MKLKVYSKDGSDSGEKEFPLPEFEGDKGLQALKQVLVAYMANRRQGNASTKTRSEVHGTGKKPFRQKGTGSARQGTRVAPQHYHGGVAFGPKPRDYSKAINRKMKRLALSRALYDRATDGEISVIEKWEMPERKTRLFAGVVNRIAPKGRVLVVDDSWSDQNLLAARNIERIIITDAKDINAFDLSRYDSIIVSEKGVECIINRINGQEQ